MYFHSKMVWPPATHDVITRNHSNWPSLTLSQNVREGWTNSYGKRQELMFYPLGKTLKNLKGSGIPLPLGRPRVKLGKTNVKMKWPACHEWGERKNLSPRQESLMLLHYFLVVGSLPCSQGFSTVAGRTFKSRLSCGGRGGRGGGRERVRVREKESFSVLLTGSKVCGNLTGWGGGGR